jgi:hypothetical protein
MPVRMTVSYYAARIRRLSDNVNFPLCGAPSTLEPLNAHPMILKRPSDMCC